MNNAVENIHLATNLDTLIKKKFIFVAGKGGVGKTTISLVIGRLAAKNNIKTLVCLTNAPLKYAEILGYNSVSFKIRKFEPNLSIINLNSVASREEYGLKILKNKIINKMVFSNKFVNNFLDVVPGLSEWAMFGKATFHALEKKDDKYNFDLVVFDSPSTGHGLDILSLSQTIASSISSGRIREEALERLALIKDSKRCEILPVTLAQEMPTNEVLEMICEIKNLKLPISRIIVNMIASQNIFTQKTQNQFESAISTNKIPNWMIPSSQIYSQMQIADFCLKRLADETLLPIIELPLLGDSGLNKESLTILTNHFYEKIKYKPM